MYEGLYWRMEYTNKVIDILQGYMGADGLSGDGITGQAKDL